MIFKISMSNTSYNDLTIIVPTLNEKDNLKLLLPKLEKDYPEASIIIADDGSNDGTFEYLKELSHSSFKSPFYLLDRKLNELVTNDHTFDVDYFKQDITKLRSIGGLTASVLDGIAITKTENFAVIDADFQHPPEIIGEMHSLLKDSDLSCAYRAQLEGFPFYRKLITWTGTFIANFVLPNQSKVKDPLSGAFAGKTKNLKQYFVKSTSFKASGFKVLFDLLKILKPEIKISQYGYAFQTRKAGDSKMNFGHLLDFFTSIFDARTKKAFYAFIVFAIVFLIGIATVIFIGDFSATETLREFAKARPEFLRFSKLLTDHGKTLYYLIFIFMLIKGLITKNKRLTRIAVTYILVQIVASLVITGSLKSIVGRPRPGRGLEHHFFTNRSTYKSFPSGHATDVFASAGVIWMFTKSYILAGLAFLFSLAIALTRVFVGSHYILDITFGMAVGFLTALWLSLKRKI